MTGLEIWQIMAIMVTISGILVGPAIWYSRNQSNKNEQKIDQIVISFTEAMDKSSDKTDDLVKSIMVTNEKNSREHREDLKEFRKHFDEKIGEIFSSIDTKNKELREYINSELLYIKNLINDLDTKIDMTREKGHELEKKLMRVENDVQKNFVSREHFDAIIKLQGKLTND
ncbi:MAG: hypothetical protein R3230_00920 [Nitrosopumilaceae archaeon]|nr:hypothetical protein [Nitrosopumilaceae archaeon]